MRLQVIPSLSIFLCSFLSPSWSGFWVVINHLTSQMLRETIVGMLSSLKDSHMSLMCLNQIVLILLVFAVSKLVVVLNLWISFDYKPVYFKCDSTSEIYAVFCCFIVSGILCSFETLNTSMMLTPRVCFERFSNLLLVCSHFWPIFGWYLL